MTIPRLPIPQTTDEKKESATIANLSEREMMGKSLMSDPYAPYIDTVPTIDISVFLNSLNVADEQAQKKVVADAIAGASEEFGSFWVTIPSRYDKEAWERVIYIVKPLNIFS